MCVPLVSYFLWSPVYATVYNHRFVHTTQLTHESNGTHSLTHTPPLPSSPLPPPTSPLSSGASVAEQPSTVPGTTSGSTGDATATRAWRARVNPLHPSPRSSRGRGYPQRSRRDRTPRYVCMYICMYGMHQSEYKPKP